jgi:3-hydroxyisobutyrate dehydrogenase
VSWGFVGLGEMGAPMAANLAAAGLGLTVFDTDPERVALVRGARAAADVAEVFRGSAVVCVCVRDEGQLDAVASAGVAAGTTLVIHSTVGPAGCRRIASDLAAADVAVVDAPVSGMQMAAAAGTLTFFVGGDDDAVERARPGLEAMGSTLLRVGGVGAGQVVKLANNLVAFGTAGVVREAVALARSSGVDPETLLGALGQGTARSWVIDNWSWLTGEWAAGQPAVEDIVRKDLRAAYRACEQAGIEAPFAELAACLVPSALMRHD